MASGWVAEGLDEVQVADGESYHRALYHDGDLRRPVGWHRDSVGHLLDLAVPHITDGALVVDYGSGTGAQPLSC
jgi:hypothetical protein